MVRFTAVVFVILVTVAGCATPADETLLAAASASQSRVGAVLELYLGEDFATPVSFNEVKNVSLVVSYPNGTRETIALGASPEGRFNFPATQFASMEVRGTFVLRDGREYVPAGFETMVLKPWHASVDAACSAGGTAVFYHLYERSPNTAGAQFGGANSNLVPLTPEQANGSLVATLENGTLVEASPGSWDGSSRALRFQVPAFDVESVNATYDLTLAGGMHVTQADVTLTRPFMPPMTQQRCSSQR